MSKTASKSDLIKATCKKQVYDTGVAKPILFICDCGHNESARIIGIHSDWALLVECVSESCEKAWFVCNRCTTARSKMTTTRQLKRHHREQHKKSESPIDNQRKGCPEKRVATLTPTKFRGILLHDRMTEKPKFFNSPCNDMQTIESPIFFGADTDDNLEEDVVFWERNSSLGSPEWFPCDDETFNCFKERASHNFFRHSHYCEIGRNGGFEYLAKKSMLDEVLRDEDLATVQYTQEEMELQMKIARMALSMSKRDHSKFAEILHSVWKIGCQDGYVTCHDIINTQCNILSGLDEIGLPPNFIVQNTTRQCDMTKIHNSDRQWRIKIPQKSNDIRKMFTEGKSSVAGNLPFPPIKTDIENHSYLSPIDCLRDFLAHAESGHVSALPIQGEAVPFHDTVSHCAESKRALNLLSATRQSDNFKEHRPLLMFGVFWSDDFEVNSASKANRGSCWIKTLSIVAKKGTRQTLNHTYPIAVGRKNDCHDAIESRIENDLQTLRNGLAGRFYDGSEKKQGYFSFEILATLQDQPERRSWNHVGAGSGTYTARWGVSADNANLMSILPCCEKCLDALMEGHRKKQYTKIESCEVCLGWDALSESSIAMTPLPKHYPHLEAGHSHCRTVLVDNKLFLRPFRLTYEGLCGALDVVHEKIVNGEWSEEASESFLKVEGMTADKIKEIIECATNTVILQMDLSEEDSIAVERAKELKPQLYEKCTYPPQWTRSNTDLQTHPDVIMHLLFLGVVRTVHQTIKRWLTSMSKYAPFLNENEHFLDGFKNVSIDWLKVLPYKVFGGWVSENHLGFARIMLWFFQNIKDTVPTRVDNKPPEGLPPTKWLKKHFEYWLRIRGLDRSGKKDELKERVLNLMAQPAVPEPLSIPTKSASDVLDALVALDDMLQCVMAAEVRKEDIMKMQYCTRIFLSKFHHMSETVRKSDPCNKEKPTVLSSFNFQSLMNLSEAMEMHGPLRSLWEGDVIGEGFLRLAKPQITQGMFGKWHYNLMKNILMEKALRQICDDEKKSNALSILRQQSAKYHAYASRQSVLDIVTQSRLSRKKPLSCVLVANQQSGSCRLFSVLNDHNSLLEIEISNQIDALHKFGLDYFSVTCDDNHIQSWEDIEKEHSKHLALGFVVMLPLLNRDVQQNCNRFAVVAWNWRHLITGHDLMSLIL